MAMMSVATSSFTPSNLLAHTRNARLESFFLPLNFQTPVAAVVAGDRRRRRREPLMIRNAITSVLGITLGGGAGTRLYPLTKKRAKPAVPLGANYRLIDIPVSNCLNSNVQKIYVLTQFNSTSLNRHLSCAYGSSMGGYKDEGFVKVLAAQQSPENPNWFQVEYKKQYKHRNPKLTTFCACGEFSSQPFTNPQNYKDTLQNVDLPEIQPKKKKKPFPVPIKKMIQESRKDKMLARKGIEKTLIAPKNGILVPELVPVAHSVLENWKILIKGITQLLTVVSVYGCSNCSEIHVGPAGHEIQDCRGTGSERRNSFHTWVRGSANDVLTPVEAYHVFDPFGKRVKHETRFAYDRIPAVVELCIQAGVDLPEYPSRRRTEPIRMMGKRVIYRGGFVEEPKAHRAEDRTSLLYELDTYAAQLAQNPPSPPTDIRQLAEQTLRAYGTVRGGVRKLMRLYSVKACGYCSEINVGPWGHNVKLCGAFKHQWRDGKHGWQDSTLDEVVPPNYVWHVKDPNGPPLKTGLKRYYGKAPAVVELCVQAGAEIPSPYKPMMRLDIIVPDSDEARFVF